MPRDASTTPSSPDAFRAARTQLVLGAGLVAVGLAVAGTLDRSVGGIVLLAGWLVTMWALHRLGRSGPG